MLKLQCGWAICTMGLSPVQCSCHCACNGRDEAHDRARDAEIQDRAHGEMWKRAMEDKKSERRRGDRMRKLTEGDGGSWVKLSSKSSQSQLIPISYWSRQKSFFNWPCLRCVCVKKRWGQIIYDWRWPLSKHNLWARSHSCSHCCEIEGPHWWEGRWWDCQQHPLLLLTLIRWFRHSPPGHLHQHCLFHTLIAPLRAFLYKQRLSIVWKFLLFIFFFHIYSGGTTECNPHL